MTFLTISHYCENLNTINEPQFMCYAEESGWKLSNKRTKRVFTEKGCRSAFSRIRTNYQCLAKCVPNQICRQWRGRVDSFLPLITSLSTWMYVMHPPNLETAGFSETSMPSYYPVRCQN